MGSSATVKTPEGKQQVFLYGTDSIVEIEFDDNTVFTATVDKQKYTASWMIPARYHPNRSNCSAVKNATDSVAVSIEAIYPIILVPTIENEYLTTSSVSESPDSVTVTSIAPTNPTTIGYANLSYANSNVILMVDGEDYISALADAKETVSHYYEGTWDTPHTFA